MNNEFCLKITTKNYESVINNLSPEILLMSRKQRYNKNQKQIDAYGEYWMIVFANLKPGQVSLRNGKDFQPLAGPCGILIGSYSVIELQFQKTKINWYAISSIKDLPQELHRKTFLFKWDGEIPKNFDTICKSIKTMEKKEIEMQRYSSAVAVKTKNFIDKNFSEILLIQKIAQKLKYSRAVMTREFTKAYGLSPVEYRQKVRVYRAVRVLSSGASVTTALIESGFSSQTQFFHQFKKHLGTQPFNYKIQK